MDLAQLYVIGNQRVAVCLLCARVRDLDIEVALALIKIADAPVAFVQQVLIDCAFLVHRHQIPHAAFADLDAIHHDQHFVALRNIEGIVQVIGRRIILPAGQLYLGLQQLLLFVVRAQLVDRRVHCVARHPRVPLQLRGFPELIRTQPALTVHSDRAHPRLPARGHDVVHIHLLVPGVDRMTLDHLGLVIAVRGQQIPDELQPAVQLVLGVRRPRTQLGCAHQEAGQRLIVHTVHIHPAEKQLRRAVEDDPDRILRPDAVHLDIGVEPRCVQAAQAAADLLRVQRLARLQCQLALKRLQPLRRNPAKLHAAHLQSPPGQQVVCVHRGQWRTGAQGVAFIVGRQLGSVRHLLRPRRRIAGLRLLCGALRGGCYRPLPKRPRNSRSRKEQCRRRGAENTEGASGLERSFVS